MYDVVIIGAGVIGTAVARELSKYQLKTAVLEKDNDVSNGTTKANSAIVHGGYDAKEGSLMAKYNALGNAMSDTLCEELDVPFKRNGSLVIAFSEEEMKHVEELYARGIKNGIPGLEILDRAGVIAVEPHVNPNVVGALYYKSAGIVGPWELAIAQMENAVVNGVELFLEQEVKNIEKLDNGYKIITDKGEFLTKTVVNCAGVHTDIIHNMVAEPTYKILPRRGQYFVMDKTQGDLVNCTIFQCPTKLGKGILVTPTVHGNLLVGPDAQDMDDREDLATTREQMAFIRDVGSKSIPTVSFRDNIRNFSGMRAESDRGDFIIEEAKDAEGFFDVAGIKSPGLSAAPAIGVAVVELMQNSGVEMTKKENFNPKRVQEIFMHMTDEQKAAKIKENPAYGRIICRCEMITEGEIIDCIKRPVGATTIDAVKRRCRPGTGRCQGGFCGPRVQEILAKELDIKLEDVLLDKKGSYILTGETKVSQQEEI